MDNAEIASVLKKIAALLEVKGEIHFKTRSYQRAAQTIYAHARPLAEVYRESGVAGLEALPGVGEGTARKIEQLLTTGKCRQYEDLRKSLPPGIEELLAVPSLGPRTAALLARELKIASLADLERAIKRHRIRELPRMGARQEEKLLRGLEIVRRGQERLPLGKALPLAMEILGLLAALPGLKRATCAGSLRRMQETVGDLDFLAAVRRPGDAAAVMESFTSLPLVSEALSRGETKSSVRLKTGIQADLRLVPDDCFGAALHYFTGSKTHNIQIRELGVKRGLKINEYGIFRGTRRIGGRREEDVFRSLGLPLIPPEIREGTGEIEEAAAGRLPRLVGREDIRGDLHVHTSASDGVHSLEQMADAARRLEFEYLAICEHSRSLKMAGGLSVDALRRRNREIDRLNGRLRGLLILKGAEVDILADGRLDYPDEVLAELDVVVAAIHTRFSLGEAEQTRRAVRALVHPRVTMLAHPTGRKFGRRGPCAISLGEIVKAARDHGKALELNSQIERLDLSDAGIRLAREAGVPIAVNSDAHHLDQLRSVLDLGVPQARRGWLAPAGVLNALPTARLLRRLRA